MLLQVDQPIRLQYSHQIKLYVHIQNSLEPNTMSCTNHGPSCEDDFESCLFITHGQESLLKDSVIMAHDLNQVLFRRHDSVNNKSF